MVDIAIVFMGLFHGFFFNQPGLENQETELGI